MNPYQLKTPVVVDLYQGEHPVDWASMNPKPYRALFQCTRGQFHRDERCATYIQECNALGIKYGLYHFLFPNNIHEQVEVYKETVTALGGLGHFPPIVDVEYKPPKQKQGQPDNMPRGRNWALQIKLFLDIVEAWSGQKPMIYTSRNFWQYTFDHSGNPPAWTDEYPLWVAWYPNKLTINNLAAPRENRMPKGWTKWSIWQYSESGRTDGYLANDFSMITPEYMAALDGQFA